MPRRIPKPNRLWRAASLRIGLNRVARAPAARRKAGPYNLSRKSKMPAPVFGGCGPGAHDQRRALLSKHGRRNRFPLHPIGRGPSPVRQALGAAGSERPETHFQPFARPARLARQAAGRKPHYSKQAAATRAITQLSGARRSSTAWARAVGGDLHGRDRQVRGCWCK